MDGKCTGRNTECPGKPRRIEFFLYKHYWEMCSRIKWVCTREYPNTAHTLDVAFIFFGWLYCRRPFPKKPYIQGGGGAVALAYLSHMQVVSLDHLTFVKAFALHTCGGAVPQPAIKPPPPLYAGAPAAASHFGRALSEWLGVITISIIDRASTTWLLSYKIHTLECVYMARGRRLHAWWCYIYLDAHRARRMHWRSIYCYYDLIESRLLRLYFIGAHTLTRDGNDDDCIKPAVVLWMAVV